MGSFFALLCAIQFQLPWFVCLLAAAIGGAIWGIFPGLFKAYFNVNEVITSIMFNWIGMYLVNLILANSPKMLASGWGASNSRPYRGAVCRQPRCHPAQVARSPRLFGNSSWINIGIILTIIFALIVWVVLQKTTFGYELKACGLSRDASPVRRHQRQAQHRAVHGHRRCAVRRRRRHLLLGRHGSVRYRKMLSWAWASTASPLRCWHRSNPIGTIFSALFISYIQVGGDCHAAGLLLRDDRHRDRVSSSI